MIQWKKKKREKGKKRRVQRLEFRDLGRDSSAQKGRSILNLGRNKGTDSHSAWGRAKNDDGPSGEDYRGPRDGDYYVWGG